MEPRERSPVLNAHFTQNFRPKQVYGPRTVHQVAERRKRSKDKEVQDKKRGRQRKKEPGARSQERQGQGPSGNKARTHSKDWVCDCQICTSFPGRELVRRVSKKAPEGPVDLDSSQN